MHIVTRVKGYANFGHYGRRPLVAAPPQPSLKLLNKKGISVTSNYEAICAENQQRYGTDIQRIAPMLLVERYQDRTHFIFELLQNAEDALGRRGRWSGDRKVTFALAPSGLTLSHFGRPFNEADVRGICGIAVSTKNDESIGRFGIGFKSVFTFTDRPQIHSGDEDFAIERYVHPTRVPPVERLPEETKIILPFRAEDSSAHDEIVKGLRHLGPRALLFLKHIEELNWCVKGGASGAYLRGTPVELASNIRRITVVGYESGTPEVDQTWLVFHRDITSPVGEPAGRIEIAFAQRASEDHPGRWAVEPIASSPLVVFFPTAVETHLGFLVQGPYSATPSRDNIHRDNAWNESLLGQTAELLIESLRWLRDEGVLDASTLRCLPLERDKFPEGEFFTPLFDAVRQAFQSEALLPCFEGGYVVAADAKLARTKELRELFTSEQLTHLFEGEASAWLTGDITQDRTPEIRQYVTKELKVVEVVPDRVIPRLTRQFLEAQPEAWILKLYEFLSGQEAALRRRLDAVPLIRLSDGTHVVARVNGQLQAFLPSTIQTSFPTVHPTVCSTPEARLFLSSLGITEPDPVDDVIRNVLPRYQAEEIDADDDQYADDIGRIRAAFYTDSKQQQEKLVIALRNTAFVAVYDAGSGEKYMDLPGNVYLPTERLKQLFSGVSDVMVVDDSYKCLLGERELLEACGALRYPRPIEAPHALTAEDRRQLRREAGHEQTSGAKDQITDWTLLGFDALIDLLPTLSPEQRLERARLIWESLIDLEERRGHGVFTGLYKWTHYGQYERSFPAAFVRRLNQMPWVPHPNGQLCSPSAVTFDSLGWRANPFLLTQFSFRPPLLDQLALEAGIEPAALDLLRQLGLTSVEELTERLRLTTPSAEPEEDTAPPSPEGMPPAAAPDVYDEAWDLYGGDMPEVPPATPDPDGGDGPASRGRASGGGQGAGSSGYPSGSDSGKSTGRGGPVPGAKSSPGRRSPGSSGGRPFISYVGTHADTEEADPDSLDQAARMHIESRAIRTILQFEPELNRTDDGNPGFDLYEADAQGKPTRWVEVKSMTGSLANRPVGLSRRQFEMALEKGPAYWLYIVEHANDPERTRVLRIQDPAGQARTFTFDNGWAEVAQVEYPAPVDAAEPTLR